MNFKFAGISTTDVDAPVEKITTTTTELVGNSNGKLFVAITDLDPNVPNVIGLIFNGDIVKVRKNETYMGTDTADVGTKGYKLYAFDVPMRYIHEVPKPATYTIQFVGGVMTNERFTEEIKSPVYILEVISDEPRVGDYVPD